MFTYRVEFTINGEKRVERIKSSTAGMVHAEIERKHPDAKNVWIMQQLSDAQIRDANRRSALRLAY